jgi:hypothetical protein
MANVFGLHAIADGLARYLDRAFPTALRDDHPCTFEAVASGGLTQERPLAAGTRVTIWPYRVLINEHDRNREFVTRPGRVNRPLPLDVHLLVTIWADTPPEELLLFAWTMRELYQLSLLDRSVLTTVEAGFSSTEQIQLTPAEMSVEDMMRIWDAVTPSYRLSVPFVARVLHIDIEQDEGRAVVARRLHVTEPVAP